MAKNAISFGEKLTNFYRAYKFESLVQFRFDVEEFFPFFYQFFRYIKNKLARQCFDDSMEMQVGINELLKSQKKEYLKREKKLEQPEVEVIVRMG